MDILNYEQLIVSCEKQEGRCVYIYMYTKQNDCYTVYDTVDDKHKEYLERAKAYNTNGSIYMNYDKDSTVNIYIYIGDTNTDVLLYKEYVSTMGASLIKKLKHLTDHTNLFVCFKQNIREFVSGLVLGYYKYDFLLKEQKKKHTLSIIGKNTKEYVQIYNSQNFVRFLGDTPANLLTPLMFTKYGRKYCDNLQVQVLNKSDMRKMNMNLLLSVAQGSTEEPYIMKIKYNGRNDDKVDVSLVGKGITFDSGGISLKPAANMSAMKGDMMGAATLLAAIKLAADTSLCLNIEAILPLSENMPGNCATKPGDVYTGMGGKSVEIDNTDAEGRLILADALTLAQESSPTYVFDMATLTGAMATALGEAFFGYFTNDNELSTLIHDAGIVVNDPAWRMPLSSLYLSSLQSNVADLKNVGGRKGGACTAAIFLKEFVRDTVRYVHFDIAGVDWDHRNKTLYGTGMTGKGLSLVYELLRRLANK